MRYFMISCLFLFSLSISAQSYSINGVVEDEMQEPLPYATVSLTNIVDSTLVKASITGENGKFQLENIPSGNYSLTITSVGFQPYQLSLENFSEDINLDTITLKTATEALNAVNLVAEKTIIQVLADKTVFNVENSLNATGTNGWELLRKAPGLIIDNNGSIILEGKTGVQIYIDGRPSQLAGDDLQALLQSLQSTDVGSIEIITQPSSKYDAAGTAGIINIKLKKNKNLGTNGSVTGGLTYGEYARWRSSITFNNRTQTGNLYGTYSNGFGNYDNFLYLYREQSGTQFDARTESRYNYNNNNLRLGYDFFASAKSTLGIIFNGFTNNNHNYNNSRTPIRPVGSQLNDSVLVANNKSTSDTENFNVNINYRYANTLGRELNIDADYGKYKNDGVAFQPNIYLNGRETAILSQNITRQVTPIDIDIATLRADYEQDFLSGKLGVGFKFSFVNTQNTFDFFNQVNGDYIRDDTQSNRFQYTENINAGYFNYNLKWEKWNVQLGMRVENTISDGNLTSTQQNANNRVKRNYTNWFPSGGLTYQLNQKNQFALTYSKRIARPNYASLNPFEYKIDELSFRRGNPFLQPQYTDNIKLSHTHNHRLTTSLTYTYISDFFAQITQAEGQNRNFISERNIANQEVINLGISYPLKVNDWWNVYTSLNAYQSKFSATDPNFFAITQKTLSVYGQNTFTLPAGIRLEVSGWYSSPSVWAGTYQTSALGSLNVAFQKKFFNEKLNARISFNDILYTSPWSGTTRFGELFIAGSGGSDSRNVALSLTYDFGRKEVKQARDRDTGLEEEQDRI
ncbi:MAG: outer membrane beta-barrel family protein [Leeuwenhoekiella sp.]